MDRNQRIRCVLTRIGDALGWYISNGGDPISKPDLQAFNDLLPGSDVVSMQSAVVHFLKMAGEKNPEVLEQAFAHFNTTALQSIIKASQIV